MLPFSRGLFACTAKRQQLSTNASSAPKIFDKILIANRGEIAIRVMKTAKSMGIKCVAVFSEADKHSQHVQMADEAVLIGPASSADSYLRIDKIIESMKRTGAQAVHPGYGFLSENSKFAEELERANLTFIGPPSSAIQSMGSKSESKQIMESAGVSCVPGYHGTNQDAKFLAGKAEEIGYPVMIKAVLGGGGKGMRIARGPAEFQEMLASSKRESAKSFGDDRVLLEKYIEQSRHIEVQVFADRHGNCVYLFERDCSIQRRHQKVIEEAPAPNLSKELRQQLGEKAVAAAKAVNYVGAGTVEFIFDCSDQSFYFMEMNTRLQVEHPVTEMITGQDLVEWQIKVAAGHCLPMRQDELQIDGHSMEARIYAENPDRNFMPDTGWLMLCTFPENGPHLRIDTGVKMGDEISIHYDPMIAKVAVKGQDRLEAVRRLDAALSGMQIAGVCTNAPFVQRILRTEDFVNCDIDTGFIPRHKDTILSQQHAPSRESLVIAGIALLCHRGSMLDPTGLKHFRPNYGFTETVSLTASDTPFKVKFEHRSGGIMMTVIDDCKLEIELIRHAKQEGAVLIDSVLHAFKYLVAEDKVQVWSDRTGHCVFGLASLTGMRAATASKAGTGRIQAPMPCKITQILVKTGDVVKAGTPLLIAEAMKMEQIIKADVDGVVGRVHFQTGDIVPDQGVIMELEGPAGTRVAEEPVGTRVAEGPVGTRVAEGPHGA